MRSVVISCTRFERAPKFCCFRNNCSTTSVVSVYLKLLLAAMFYLFYSYLQLSMRFGAFLVALNRGLNLIALRTLIGLPRATFLALPIKTERSVPRVWICREEVGVGCFYLLFLTYSESAGPFTLFLVSIGRWHLPHFCSAPCLSIWKTCGAT